METEQLDYSIAEAVIRVQDLVDRIESTRRLGVRLPAYSTISECSAENGKGDQRA